MQKVAMQTNIVVNHRIYLLVPFWFDGCDERCLCAFLLITEAKLDIRRLFSFGSVGQFTSLDGNGNQNA
jgi:hypothetical protein